MRRFAALAVTGMVACQGAPALEPPPTGASMIDDQLKQDLEVLKNARILFAHHSVGDNLLEGLGELSAEAKVPLDIVPVDQKRTGGAPRIEQIRPGGNGKGLAKIDDFLARALAEPADGAQVVSMKLCFADFAPNTNVDELIDRYQ